MSTAAVQQRAGQRLDPAPVGVRAALAGLWTTVMFVFAYVDLFGLYRADFRADLERGVVAGFTLNGGFLLFTTVYVTVASLVVAGSLLLPARGARLLNLVLAPVYTLTIVVSAVGEMGYFVLGSAVEVLLLAVVVRTAWLWPSS